MLRYDESVFVRMLLDELVKFDRRSRQAIA